MTPMRLSVHGRLWGPDACAGKGSHHTIAMNNAVLLVLSTMVLAAAQAVEPAVRVVAQLDRLREPVQVVGLPGSDALLVVERAGLLKRWQSGTQPVTVLDVQDRVQTGKGYHEEGLLAVAVHPRFPADPRLFAWLSRERPKRMCLVAWRWDAEAGLVDPQAEEVLLEQPWEHANHKGGVIRFGPDGFLYLSLGDGGAGGDPRNNAQNLASLLGKILRLDIDRRDPGRPYGVPADNPFVGRDDARSEIWAYGLRNVWRMAFDPLDGRLWAADVGQNAQEEVDVIVRGGNYGWKRREGRLAYEGGRSLPGDVEPVHVYDRDQGISITGGAVYRGTAIPALVGWYVFGDFASGRLWAIPSAGGAAIELTRTTSAVASIDADQHGELWLSDLKGSIFRLESP
jgi:glucose/arabinose dehydrogenase